jgi:hypothetical protein
LSFIAVIITRPLLEFTKSMQHFDDRVRGYVYDMILRDGEAPSIAELAHEAGSSPEEIRKSLQRLAVARNLVIHPETGAIVMAPPFAAAPTPFPVSVPPRRFYANCIWDALGIPAMMHKDARIETSCGDCGSPSTIEVREQGVHGEGLMHFAIPARDWWKDIVFT